MNSKSEERWKQVHPLFFSIIGWINKQDRANNYYPDMLKNINDEFERDSFSQNDFEIIEPGPIDVNPPIFEPNHQEMRDQSDDWFERYDMDKSDLNNQDRNIKNVYENEVIENNIAQNKPTYVFDYPNEVPVSQENQPAFQPQGPIYYEDQEEMKMKEEMIKEEIPTEVDVIMESSLHHLYNYIALRNGGIMCFLCEKLIDHDHIKIFCAECSETEYIKVPFSEGW
jgi:hypothetical protein